MWNKLHRQHLAEPRDARQTAAGGQPQAAASPAWPEADMDPAVAALVQRGPSPTDPSGSYTGKPLHPGETPVQDADDL